MRNSYFNKQELSRVLSAHAGGQLKRFRVEESQQCCVFMAAECTDEVNIDPPFKWNTALAFDSQYQPQWSTEQFLTWLIEKGLA